MRKCKRQHKSIKAEIRHLLNSLIDDFKWIGPSMHIDKVKPLIGLNSVVSCKTKSTKKNKGCVCSFELEPFVCIFSSPNAINSIHVMIHLKDNSL